MIFEIQCATIYELGDPSQTSFGVSYNVVTLQSSASFPSCQFKQVHLYRFKYQQTPILVHSPNSCHHLRPDKAAKRTCDITVQSSTSKKQKCFTLASSSSFSPSSFNQIKLYEFAVIKCISIFKPVSKWTMKTLEEILKSWLLTLFSDSSSKHCMLTYLSVDFYFDYLFQSEVLVSDSDDINEVLPILVRECWEKCNGIIISSAKSVLMILRKKKMKLGLLCVSSPENTV